MLVIPKLHGHDEDSAATTLLEGSPRIINKYF